MTPINYNFLSFLFHILVFVSRELMRNTNLELDLQTGLKISGKKAIWECVKISKNKFALQLTGDSDNRTWWIQQRQGSHSITSCSLIRC